MEEEEEGRVRDLEALNVMEDKIEETWTTDCEGGHIRYNFATQKWDKMENCGPCGKIICECVHRPHFFHISQDQSQFLAGGGEQQVTYVFVVLLL